MTVRQFQRLIAEIYLDKDRRRGLDGTFRWFAEEVGELARGLRRSDRAELAGEFADTFAWLVSLASQAGIDLQDAAAAKYQGGCPKCHNRPCSCSEEQAFLVRHSDSAML